MILKPIGIVRNGIDHHLAKGWKNTVSRLEISPELEPALYGIDEFSLLQIVFWFDRLRPIANFLDRIHPMGNTSLPLVGRFATHSPHRPNPIGLTIAELLERNGNILTVRGLDALDGTPLLDIKPFIMNKDLLSRAREPAWTTRR
jgi:tRNA-Thr(GGU) m(6)t(6)A37 methyltransferase TsaA